jgi:hypothetical protein
MLRARQTFSVTSHVLRRTKEQLDQETATVRLPQYRTVGPQIDTRTSV